MKIRPLLCALPVMLLAPAFAVPPAEHESVRREVQSGRLQPLAQILQQVQQRHKGRVIDIELERAPDGRRWYEIKLASGLRTEIYVDAITGQEIARPGINASTLMSMASVVGAVTRLHPGVVLQAELQESRSAAPYYEIQLLTRDGRELLLRADARTGALLTEPALSREQALALLPLPRLLEDLERRYQARATEVELKLDAQRRSYYEIELQVGSGRNIEVHVDALSGRLISEDDWR